MATSSAIGIQSLETWREKDKAVRALSGLLTGISAKLVGSLIHIEEILIDIREKRKGGA
ncbi:MAG: hypothetical protein IMF03_08975 [Proteobacteria bacterium]|nr:hypothetical protein [Pseudomonadota bacterium]